MQGQFGGRYGRSLPRNIDYLTQSVWETSARYVGGFGTKRTVLGRGGHSRRHGLHTSSDLLRIGDKWRMAYQTDPNLARPYVSPTRDKRYILSMFPYPSGALHMGHARVYTISDALSRYARLRGHQVLHPMGWDAFGLPAENAAIERGIPPDRWTRQNIAQMRQQLDALCFLFDWEREITTCEPNYYRWTQWIFLQLYRAGLAYRQEGLVNWDPVDQTVLADEQVDPTGKSWRSGALVERRPLTQWYLRITAYQDELLKGLETLKEWPEAVKEMQRHWIVDHDKGEYKLRDWLISRQRYWGTPIPIVHCPLCGTVPISEEQLPLRLPENVPFTGKGGSPLRHVKDWWRTSCPECGHPEAQHELDTMDTFMDSSWYYWHYCAPTKPLNSRDGLQAIQAMLPVDVYIGGVEHAILHLLYARFIHKFLNDRLLTPSGERVQESFGSDQHPHPPSEPFSRLITQGLVEGLTYQCPRTGRYLRPEEIIYKPDTSKPVIQATGEEPTLSWTKMSKSKHNGVDPTGLVATYGADVLRLCILFKAPPEVALKWNTRDIAGPQRWLVRLLNLAERISQLNRDGRTTVTSSHDADINEHHVRFMTFLGKSIQSMETAFKVHGGQSKLNLAVSNLMKLSNEIERRMEQLDSGTLRHAMCALSIMLHPLAPCTSAELLSLLEHTAPLLWPVVKDGQLTYCNTAEDRKKVAT